MKQSGNIGTNILSQSSIQTIYFGGGTPSLFKPQQIQELINIIKSISYPTKLVPEITLEINPQEIQTIPNFHSAGINRFSIGIQSLNPYQLKKFNRSQSYDLKLSQDKKDLRKNNEEYCEKILSKLLDYKRNKVLENFNVDFILDLNPEKQDEDLIYKFIEKIQPPHLTLYLLEVIENTYLQKKIRIDKERKDEFSGLVKNFETIHERYIKFSNKLKHEYGYSHYEVSNFAKKSNKQQKSTNKLEITRKVEDNNANKYPDEKQQSNFGSKHNKVYWQGDKEFFGFGMGASSLLRGIHLNPYYQSLTSKTTDSLDSSNDRQVSRMVFRITNPKTLIKYEQYVKKLQTIRKENVDNNSYQQNQSLKSKISVEINLQKRPIEILQSYVMSSIRTLKGVSYQKIKDIITEGQKIESKEDTQNQYQLLVQKIQKTLQEQLGSINSHENLYFQFIFQKYDKENHQHPQITGFRLNSPHGYLIADELAHKISLIIDEIFTSRS